MVLGIPANVATRDAALRSLFEEPLPAHMAQVRVWPCSLATRLHVPVGPPPANVRVRRIPRNDAQPYFSARMPRAPAAKFRLP